MLRRSEETQRKNEGGAMKKRGDGKRDLPLPRSNLSPNNNNNSEAGRKHSFGKKRGRGGIRIPLWRIKERKRGSPGEGSKIVNPVRV